MKSEFVQMLHESMKEIIDTGYDKSPTGEKSAYIDLADVSKPDLKKLEKAPWCNGTSEDLPDFDSNDVRFWIKKGKDDAARKMANKLGYN